MGFIWHFYHGVMRQTMHFHVHDWIVLSLLVLLFGLFCLRGFGSRAKN